MTISAIFIGILIMIVIVIVIRFKRARDAARSKCTAPNNTKLNGDTTMTGAHVGNPYGTIQRCGSASLRTSRPINNGFATLEQHPHNTLRYRFIPLFIHGKSNKFLSVENSIQIGLRFWSRVILSFRLPFLTLRFSFKIKSFN